MPASDARRDVADNLDTDPLAELVTVVELVRTHRAVLVNVGYGRAARSIGCAGAFIERWQAMGGQIGAVVSWPDGTPWRFRDGILGTDCSGTGR